MDVNRLFDVALSALEREDVLLRDRFKPSDSDVAHGLAYWLFETTLVYVIFKGWLPETNVVWEHALERDPELRGSPNLRRGGNSACDLVVRGEDGHPVAAFEAKWWMDDSTKSRSALLNDAAKLRRAFKDTAVKKYLLTFWYGPMSSWDKDLQEARNASKAMGLTFVRSDRFATRLRTDPDGYFALCLLGV